MPTNSRWDLIQAFKG